MNRPAPLRSHPLPFAPQVYRPDDEAPSRPSDLDTLRIELRAEVRALRSIVAQREAPDRELAMELATLRSAIREMGGAAAANTPRRDRAAAWLRARGIEDASAAKIAAAVKRAMRNDPDQDLTPFMRTAIERTVPFAPWAFDNLEARVISVVGPSGVGKTTTLAKLAARMRIAGRSVALVSCDNFRVGALGQLERYASLLDASFHVARNAEDLDGLLTTLSEDIVFVDTSGRPPTYDGPEAAVAHRRRDGEVVETLLCMTATTRAVDAARIAAVYAPAQPSAVCITKTDETHAPSALVHGPLAADRPLAAICFGPRVPEDVEPASIEAVFARLEGQSGK